MISASWTLGQGAWRRVVRISRFCLPVAVVIGMLLAARMAPAQDAGGPRAVAATTQKAGPATQPAKMVTRRMDEMTSREVEQYLQSGGDLVFVPFGPMSGHGAFIPLGIHCHWAHALSVLMAEKANGLVYPPVFTVFGGATRTFRGAVSFPLAEQAQILEEITANLHKQGFKRVVLVAGTSPEELGGNVAVRDYFDRTEKAVWMVVGEKLMAQPEVREIYRGYPGSFGETQIGHASLRILSRGRPIPYPEWAMERKTDNGGDQPAEIFPDVRTMRTLGMVGWRYYEEGNHGNHGMAGLIFKGKSDIDLAEEVLDKSADAALPGIAALGRYVDWLDAHPVKYITPTEHVK